MKLLFSFGVCLLCIGQVILQATDEIRGENGFNESTKLKIQTFEVTRNKTGLMNLNVDCLSIIGDNLNDLSDLFSLAETKRDLLFVVEAALKRRFARKDVVIRLLDSQYPTRTGLHIQEDVKRIYFIDSGKLRFSNVLIQFGHLLSSIEFSHNRETFKTHEIPTLFQLINLHCSKSLIKMHITTLHAHNIFEQFQNKFEKLEQLFLENKFGQLNNVNLNFSDIFPSMTHLNLKYFESIDFSWCNQTFPNLQYLKIDIDSPETKINADNFGWLIKSNPQIRKLDLLIFTKSTVLYLLKVISENLPNLDWLELRVYGEENIENQNVTIYFEHLKTLVVHSTDLELPSKTTFGRLDEVKLGQSYSMNSDRWIELVKNQKTLKKLTVPQYLMDSSIQQISNAQSSLVELTFTCCCANRRRLYGLNYDQVPDCLCDATVDSVINLIKRSKQLERLHLYSGWAATNSVFESMEKQLPVGWTITRDLARHAEQVYFERNQ